jgi:predicted benzoate:H+ symporter BenE
MITGTICFSVVASGAAIIVAETLDPNSDTGDSARVVAGIINTLIGLLAGFLAGKTGKTLGEKEQPPP